MRTILIWAVLGMLPAPLTGQEPLTECHGVRGSAKVTVLRAPSGPDPLQVSRRAEITSLPRSMTDFTICGEMVGPRDPVSFVGLPEGRYSLTLMWSGLDPIEFSIREGQDTTIVFDGPATNEVRDCELIEACRELLRARPVAPDSIALEAYALHLAITLGTLGRTPGEQICLRPKASLRPYLATPHPAVGALEACAQEAPDGRAYAYLNEIERRDEDAAILRIAYRVARRGGLWGTSWRCFVERAGGAWSVQQCVVAGMS